MCRAIELCSDLKKLDINDPHGRTCYFCRDGGYLRGVISCFSNKPGNCTIVTLVSMATKLNLCRIIYFQDRCSVLINPRNTVYFHLSIPSKN